MDVPGRARGRRWRERQRLQGVKDLTLVAYQFGLHAAPGPLLGSNVVAAAVGRWGSTEQRTGPLAALLNGEPTGAWALAEDPPHDRLG